MLFAAASVILYRSTWRPRWCYAGALACVALAMHAKEVAAVGLVAMLPLAGLLPGPDAGDAAQRRRRAMHRTLPLLVLGVLATGWYGGSVWRAFAPAEIARNAGSTFKTYGEVLATSAASIPDVGRLLVYPARLSADYPPPIRRRLTERRSAAGLLLLAGWIAVAAAAVRAAPLFAFGLAWTVITYLPVANVVPLTSYFLAERYLYVPSFGLCLAGALLLAGLYGRSATRALVAALTLALVLGGAARSTLRNRDWRDSVSLWTAALRAVPQGSSRIHAELGLALLEAGRGAEAIPHLQLAVEIGPVEADFHNNLALALEQAGRPAEAVAHYERALAMEPGNPIFRYNLGRTLVTVGRPQQGLAHLRVVAQEEAWVGAPPWVGAALAARGTSPAELRATLRDWLATRGASTPTSRPELPAR
jgi:tetratricopeptide (TPR) repeat protein